MYGAAGVATMHFRFRAENKLSDNRVFRCLDVIWRKRSAGEERSCLADVKGFLEPRF